MPIRSLSQQIRRMLRLTSRLLDTTRSPHATLQPVDLITLLCTHIKMLSEPQMACLRTVQVQPFPLRDFNHPTIGLTLYSSRRLDHFPLAELFLEREDQEPPYNCRVPPVRRLRLITEVTIVSLGLPTAHIPSPQTMRGLCLRLQAKVPLLITETSPVLTSLLRRRQ